MGIYKVFVFTHNDLDGFGSGLVFESLFGKDNVEISENSYAQIVNNVKKFIENKDYENYDEIFMTDISIPEEHIALVEEIDKLFGDKFTLIDHHETALWQNKYKWSNVCEIKNGKKQSGTSLCIDYFLKNKQWFEQNGVDKISDVQLKNTIDFAEVVRSYDTWEWTETNNVYAEDFNAFLYLNIKSFKNYIRENNYKPVISEEAYEIINKNKEEFNKIVLEKNKEIIPVEFNTPQKLYKMGVVYVGLGIDTSKLGNDLSKLNPNYDGILMATLETKKVSIRTENDVSLIPLAKEYFNGGGHPKSCGGSISDVEEFIKLIEGVNKPISTLKDLFNSSDIKQLLTHNDDNLLRIVRMKYLLETATYNTNINTKNIFFNKLGMCIHTSESEFFIFNYKGILYVNKNIPKVVIAKKYTQKDFDSGLPPYLWLSKAIRSNYFGITDETYTIFYKLFGYAYDMRKPVKDKEGKKISNEELKLQIKRL